MEEMVRAFFLQSNVVWSYEKRYFIHNHHLSALPNNDILDLFKLKAFAEGLSTFSQMKIKGLIVLRVAWWIIG